jgi:FMN phosphatase YigB (HAD superfamily)
VKNRLPEGFNPKISSADADVISSFKSNFAFLKKLPVVLYGVGLKTKVLLEHIEDYDIVGLMDKSNTGNILYGKKVLDPEEVAGLSRHIVIISNYASADLIYRRIAGLEESGISIFHLNGTRPKDSFPPDELGSDTAVRDQNYDALKKSIDMCDVVSFDIFDTILTRKCLYASDIFHIVERRLLEEHGISGKYAEKRIEADKIAHSGRSCACNINSIYRVMTEELDFECDDIKVVIDLELETEKEYAIPRNRIVEAMRYARSLNKLVVLTSDIYFPEIYIKELLHKNKISGYDMLALSSELNKSKYQGDLWEHLMGLFGAKRILHIGDDEFSDIRQAAKCGIDTFMVRSSRELFDSSAIRDLADRTGTLDDRLLLGRSVSMCFNDPFALHDCRRLKIEDYFLAGYAFFGPLVFCFMKWLINLCSEQGIRRILFLSRDCYVLHKIYEKYKAMSGTKGLPEADYFYASRRALSVASIIDKEDISEVFRLAPYVTKISFGQFCFAAFGIKLHDKDAYKEKYLYELQPELLLEHILKDYADEIIRAAAEERECYRRYFQGLDIRPDEMTAVVNFVSGGITQHYFEKVFDHEKLKFIYFQTTVDFKDVVNKSPFYALYGSNLSPYTDSSNQLIKYYLAAESIFSSPEEQLVGFLPKGTPVFESVTPKRDFSGISRCHEGIESFFQEIAETDSNMLTRSYSNELIDAIFGALFSSGECDLADNIRSGMNIRDALSPNQAVMTLSEQ